MKTNTGNFTAGLVGTAFALSLVIFGYTISYPSNKNKEQINETSALIKQAVFLSAGEDRIWSLSEQSQFLREMPSLKETVLTEGIGIYLVPEKDRAHVFTSAPKFETGSFPQRYLGSLDRANLENYVTKNTPKSPPQLAR